MRAYKVLIVVIIFCIYSHNEASSRASIVYKDTKTNTYKTIKILGEWGIYVTIKDGMEARCNICPRIVFQKSGSAKLIKSSKLVEKYKWTIIDDTIVFFSNNKLLPSNLLGNNKFLMIFHSSNSSSDSEVELKQVNKNCTYIL